MPLRYSSGVKITMWSVSLLHYCLLSQCDATLGLFLAPVACGARNAPVVLLLVASLSCPRRKSKTTVYNMCKPLVRESEFVHFLLTNYFTFRG